MAFLIAVTGLSGAGKTTAIDFLRAFGAGEKIYLGQAVLEEITARGLPTGPESERTVRSDFRTQHGPGALAVLAAPRIQHCLDQNINVLLDAIFDEQEYAFIRDLRPSVSPLLISIEASFQTRSQRLMSRLDRPCTPEQLSGRDEFELTRLGTQRVIERANFTVPNEASLGSFEAKLRDLWIAISNRNG